ncbi:MAG: riboflavin biosynthesis protein RibF [Clostridia bacterium]|nr:riboflavin biosynthesis protein RibF [Clostridia bacterium]
MLSIFSLPTAPPSFETVIALGVFDGVHIGHAALLCETARRAKALGIKAAVFTFSDFFKSKAPLTDKEERFALMEALGIEVVFTVSFDFVKDLSPAAFVKDILQGTCRARLAACGFNFHFGKNAEAQAEDLVRLLPGSFVMPAVYAEGAPVSSSRIRLLLEQGKVEEAASLLGRPYSVLSPVVYGKGLGNEMGFPTANMKPKTLLPAPGVYETGVQIGEKTFAAITDVGTRPTVEGEGEVRMETHIPSFSGDLYGKELRVCFIRRLREEKKFKTLAALQAQLKKDIASIGAKKG